ncbi:unnamed protein product [Lactuca saligna]|uniref:Cysteine-rich receptor-like protein kinase 2 n=1 Tax=Lactuca saligna TaxID=75948 RepID=A0AA35YXB3_LACSI|nr:unnamed protein product [Lactuca saligna]
MVVLVLLLVFLLTERGISQSTDHDINTNNSHPTVLAINTSTINLPNFIKNRKASTLAELRIEVLNTSFDDTVYEESQCRNYLSTDQCVVCSEAGPSESGMCTAGLGAYVVFDNCFARYEDFADFYNKPDVTQDGTGTPFSTCGTQLASITTFKPVVDSLLSDLRNATPKAFNFYVALTKEITSEDATMYGIGQCVGNKTVCQTCMNTAYNKSNNCLPSKEGRFFNMGCFARYSKTPLFNQTTTDVTSVLKGNSSKATILGGTLAGVVLFILIVVFWLLYRLRKAKNTEQVDLKGAVMYSYRDLQLATNNFCEENILGRGGFGEVFKGNLDVKTVVAVKKLQVYHARSKDEFENEVKLITHIHHRNLLRLLGWSSEGSDLLLVLEYMPNGSLDQFLWGAKSGTLDWNQRYEIIFGIARGLAHLHNEFHVKIIHRDIKSSNILLTDDFKPKIADFGLARFQPEDQSHVNTKFAGTLGYTAPEYALQGHLSDKVDTYSFGVVVLEIISGRRSTEVNRSSSDYLLEHAWKLYEKKIHKKCIDETLDSKQYEQEHVMNIIEIALLCTQSPVSKRPTMCEVVLMLQDGQSVGKRQLIRPSFGYNHDTRIHIES